MKVKKLTALAVILSFCTSTAVYAATAPNAKSSGTNERKVECRHKKHERKGHFGIFRGDKEMGIGNEELKEAEKNNKNFFELAKEKGYSEQQARDIIIKAKTEAINKKVSEGKLTKEKAEAILKHSKERLAKWDGSLKPNNEKGQSDNKKS